MSSARYPDTHAVNLLRGQKSQLWKIALAAALASATPGLAAGSWKGKSLELQYYIGGGAYDGFGGPGTCIVGRKCRIFANFFNIITGPSSIIFDYSVAEKPSHWPRSPLSLAPTIHDGIAINLTSPGTIQSVKVDPATNMAKFDKSRISFTANQIQVDWQGLSFTKSTIVKLDVRLMKGTDAKADGRPVNALLLTPMAASTSAVYTPGMISKPSIR